MKILEDSMTIYEKQQRALHSPFDIDTHKKLFVNYLEVVIHEDGNIVYAVPSHQEYLIQYLMNMLLKSRREVLDMVPVDYYFDMLTWLCDQTKCILVWNDHYKGNTNKHQRNALRKLRMNGVYKGAINNG